MSERAPDSGFTLTEVLVTVALLTAMLGIGAAAYGAWAGAQAHSGAARELQTRLRAVHERAITEGRALCVQFDTGAESYAVLAGTCTTPGATVSGPVESGDDSVRFGTPSFSGSPDGVTFYARGTATPGDVQVTRSGSDRTYTVSVEGLTGRVSLD